MIYFTEFTLDKKNSLSLRRICLNIHNKIHNIPIYHYKKTINEIIGQIPTARIYNFGRSLTTRTIVSIVSMMIFILCLFNTDLANVVVLCVGGIDIRIRVLGG